MKFGLYVSPSWFRFQFEFSLFGNGVVFGNNILWFWIILSGFMVLDIDNCVLPNTNDSYYSLMTTSRNTCDNVII